ncbi:M15 family metallopeptidase [Cellulomonas soli]|uniref:M15 family metallopeptidase n=1 Tax=Cellulomonas soli TaxID=931535 RepID=UPI003F837916
MSILTTAPRPPRTARRVRRRRTTVVVAILAVALTAGAGRAVADLLAGADHGHGGGVGHDPAPAVSPTALDAELQRRVEQAVQAAAADGITLRVTSGWRSAAEQQQVVQDTITRYGSEQEAHRWVLPPEHSAHVQGLAVDVGPTEGAYWLDEHGAQFGLCRTYDNEVWHFEPVIDPGGTCPERHPDSAWGW